MGPPLSHPRALNQAQTAPRRMRESKSDRLLAMPASLVAKRSRFIDWTAPFSIALVLLMAALVLLPMFRLLVTSLTGDARQLTLEHYRQLFIDPAFVKPLF